MGSKKEVGGVVLAFAGFAFLVLSVKGTWGNVWGALLGHKPGTAQLTSYRLPSGVLPSGPTSSGGSTMQTAPLAPGQRQT